VVAVQDARQAYEHALAARALASARSRRRRSRPRRRRRARRRPPLAPQRWPSCRGSWPAYQSWPSEGPSPSFTLLCRGEGRAATQKVQAT
jgi:hypothetical protein